MNEAAIKRKIQELCDAVARTPQTAVAAASEDGMYVSDSAPRDATLDGALDNLQLRLKYVMFDLEATRRENRYLRQMLESRPKPGAEDASSSGGDSGNG